MFYCSLLVIPNANEFSIFTHQYAEGIKEDGRKPFFSYFISSVCEYTNPALCILQMLKENDTDLKLSMV